MKRTELLARFLQILVVLPATVALGGVAGIIVAGVVLYPPIWLIKLDKLLAFVFNLTAVLGSVALWIAILSGGKKVYLRFIAPALIPAVVASPMALWLIFVHPLERIGPFPVCLIGVSHISCIVLALRYISRRFPVLP